MFVITDLDIFVTTVIMFIIFVAKFSGLTSSDPIAIAFKVNVREKLLRL